MYLAHLSLTNFRNYSRLELDLEPGITLLQGANAQGKTNFLEAIAYLATSRSLLASAERELVNWLAWEEPLPFARLAGELAVDGRRRKIEIALVANGGGGQRLRKEVRINGVPRRALDLVGQLPTVLFLPQDINLVAGPPAERRRYLDIALCQMQADYCRTLSLYNKVLVQRNALLRSLRDRGGPLDQLAYWDEQLIACGSLLVARRAAFVVALEQEASQRQAALTEGREWLQLRYIPRLTLAPDGEGDEEEPIADDEEGEGLWLREPSAAYETGEAAAVAEALRRELTRARRQEIAAGMSLIGPHRDDVQFLAQGRSLRTYGSRGQQRTAALAVKLAEVAVMRQALGAAPLLLLDDVMSELDARRRSTLLAALEGVTQAVVTTTDWDDFSEEFRRRAHCLQVEGGRVQRV
ncbi:MAG: DNA replication/repair protein RecF [Caldilineales bacterium]|nr:DNA replication/repair protein RecF [Caldilineales bacterium]MDW8317363.1 DNA replication/repair protein RecF [Anaerolineae bacterium]